VGVLCDEGPRYTSELIDWGAQFERDEQGRLALATEGAHSVRRVLHTRDATGREIGRVLWERATSSAAISVLKNALAVDAILENGRCVGVRFVGERGEHGRALGRATLLATGGAGQVFEQTTNPAVATGDGVALAFRAGARIADMEFVQFHPTVLDVQDAPRFLLSEALRGEGAQLVDAAGRPFMARYHPAADLAPRDVVSRSIVVEGDRTSGPIFLSLRHLDAGDMRRRFPTIAAVCLRAGLDLARDLIPVGPAAHYMMGGVETDLEGRTSVPGLFGAGEVACTRVHGANRLASNSLLEGLVFGARVGQAMRGASSDADLPAALHRPSPLLAAASGQRRLGEADIRALMWKSVGLIRSREGLREAVSALQAQADVLSQELADPDTLDHEDWRRASILTTATLIARAALRREESRGGHFRTDYPGRDDLKWQVHVTDIS
jgi:L-aspartate oxidase